MKLGSMKAVEKALRPYYAVAALTTGKGITVERMERFMHHLGNPERSYPVVHIAGTSGKTSTTYFTTSLLHAAGNKVGSTVSPHIDSLTERVQIDGIPLNETVFCEYMGQFLELAKGAPEVPSWFELMVAFALWVFQQEAVDYAVLETGLGGLHDATNVTTGRSKICVITDIGFDHMHILGDTLLAIASQKAGIIHEGNAVLMYEQPPEVMKAVYFKVSQTEDADLFVQQQPRLAAAYGHEFSETMPAYQRRNWLLAYATFRYIANRDGLELPSPEVLQSTQRLTVPGRMERVRVGKTEVILDGAHNEPKMRAFAASYQAQYGKQKVPVLLALKHGKEIDDIAPLVAQFASQVIVTEFTMEQDMPIAAMPAKDIVTALQKAGMQDITNIVDMHRAFALLLETSPETVIVTGSFYLISQLCQTEPSLVKARATKAKTAS